MDIAFVVFVSICGLLGVWLGVRYARWHKSHLGNRERNRYPRKHRRMESDTNARGVFQLAHGWLENRKSGGANTIALPLRRDIYSCHDCVDKLRHGIPWSQMPLFDPREYDDR